MNIESTMNIAKRAVQSGNYSTIHNKYRTSILNNDEEVFNYLLPYISWDDKCLSYILIVEYDRMMMLRIIHKALGKKVYCISKADIDLVFFTAVYHDRVDILKWLVLRGYKTTRHNLLSSMIIPNARMASFLSKNKLIDQYPLSVDIIRVVVGRSDKCIYPMNPYQHDGEAMKLLTFMHDKYPVTRGHEELWECKRGQYCYICSTAK